MFRMNGKTPICDAIWYSAVDITFKPCTLAAQPCSLAKFGPFTLVLSPIPELT
jgi:hypothetical protein